MIVSDIRNWDKEKQLFPQAIHKAIAFIQSANCNAISPGKYPIEGERMFMLIQEPLTAPNPYLEAHAKYVDLQYLISGQEKIGHVRKTGSEEVVENHLSEKDYILYKHTGQETNIILEPGMFSVFFPNDLHRPCVNVGPEMKIKKAVVKIHLQLFE